MTCVCWPEIDLANVMTQDSCIRALLEGKLGFSHWLIFFGGGMTYALESVWLEFACYYPGYFNKTEKLVKWTLQCTFSNQRILFSGYHNWISNSQVGDYSFRNSSRLFPSVWCSCSCSVRKTKVCRVIRGFNQSQRASESESVKKVEHWAESGRDSICLGGAISSTKNRTGRVAFYVFIHPRISPTLLLS